jgi:ABC-type bacteriocin/lantibiotic exporter with double-glycine peptidase domain
MHELKNYIKKIIGDTKKISELSSGKKQLITIYHSLCLNPEVLILDESFSNLDPETLKYVVNNLRRLSDEITIIIVTHNYDLIHENDNVLNLLDVKQYSYKEKTIKV